MDIVGHGRHAGRRRDTAAPERAGTLAGLLRVPGFKLLIISSVLWHMTRWSGLFSCGYLVAQMTDAPFLNQLAGASLLAPMLVGGMVAGSFSDRVDRRRFVLATQLVLLPISVLMFAVVRSGLVQVWMVFPFMLALGCGGLVNMTAQRPLVYETVGPEFAARALTIEAVGVGASSVFGSLVGGSLIAAVGIGAAFLFLPVALLVSAVLLTRVPPPAHRTPPGTAAVSVQGQVQESLVVLRQSPSLASMLGVTVVMNLCYFSFVPLVPVMAERFEAGPFLTGVLAASAGFGQLGAGLVISSQHVTRRGRLYVGGSTIALASLGLFAVTPMLALGVVLLVLGGVGQSGFGTQQSVLAMESVGTAERGTGQGLLSTAIGALPVGMLVLGGSAQLLGPRPALVTSSAVGLAALAVWLAKWPQVLAAGPRATVR